MEQRDYSQLMSEMAQEYAKHAPKSARLQKEAQRYLVDGGSHSIRLFEPFAPRIVKAQGAWLEDEDGHRILDFWQGHYGNVIGHNPEVVTRVLAEAFQDGYGLQTGHLDRIQTEAAEILCRQTRTQCVRFTTSGALATMYAVILARAFTGRALMLKAGGGWHGAHPWGLKGVGFHDGFEQVDSAGLPQAVTEEILITGFNDPEKLRDDFKKYGDKLACFMVEPIIGAGGLMPATKEYLQTARALTKKHGVVLILDEVVSAFHFRAGDVATLYQVKPDLMCLGKAIGGGMPVAAVAGRADILGLVGSEQGKQVKFSGGTHSAHPASMLAAQTFMEYLAQNENKIYPALTKRAKKTRQVVSQAFAEEGIPVRFAGDRLEVLEGNSLHMMLFPYDSEAELIKPEQVRNPAVCDIELSEQVTKMAFLLHDIFTVHGLGCTTYAHGEKEIERLGETCSKVAQRIKPYL